MSTKNVAVYSGDAHSIADCAERECSKTVQYLLPRPLDQEGWSLLRLTNVSSVGDAVASSDVLGFLLVSFWFWIAVVAVFAVLATMMATSSNESIRELVKQIAVWLGIVVLLPLSVWFGTSAFSPPPDKEYSKSRSRIEERINDTKDPAEKEKLRQERDRIDTQVEEAERVHYRDMFWVAYPTGLLAILIGTLFPVQAVGAGLMFGGLGSLTAGCYAYWDRMGDWLRFGSLVLALIVLLVLGTWRFRPARSP